MLPFRSLGEGTAGDYLAATITDDVITGVSQCVSVVVRNLNGMNETGSADPRQVGLNSGANYVIQGSVLGSADRSSVNVQLIDVETGSHVWAERFTTDHGDIAESGDEITRRAVRGLVRKLIGEFARRIEETVPTQDWSSNDLFLHGCAAIARPLSIENRRAAISSFEQALKRDPSFVDARIEIAGVLIANLLDSWSACIEADTARAEQLLLDVLRGDTSISRAHTFMGMLRRFQGRLHDSKLELELAIEMSPESTLATGQLGLTLAYLGEPEAAIPRLEKSLRLAPHDPLTPVNHTGLGLSHLMLGDLEAAINCLRKARVANPSLFYVHFFLAAAFGLHDEPEEADAALRQAIDLRSDVDSVAAMLARWPMRTNSRFATLFEKSVIAGLRRAGLPESGG